MSGKRVRRDLVIPALAALAVCFYTGMAAGWWAHARVSETGVVPEHPLVAASRANDPAPEPEPTVIAPVSHAVSVLRGRHLLLPIEPAIVERMRGQFGQNRGNGGRGHEAVDLLAPRGTEVHAVEGGTIAKLFLSKAGGITIYQFDPSRRFCYYYAHLDRYADRLKEGQAVAGGDLLGYVGTTGNAPPNTPHLHFAIFELTPERHWWQGTPIDPYDVFR